MIEVISHFFSLYETEWYRCKRKVRNGVWACVQVFVLEWREGRRHTHTHNMGERKREGGMEGEADREINMQTESHMGERKRERGMKGKTDRYVETKREES